MKLGMIGLGRMGGNMARRLIDGGHEVVAFDRDPKAVAEAASHGAIAAASLAEVAEKLDSPAIYWVMLPAGEITDARDDATSPPSRKPGDIVIDGGNSFWKHDLEHAKYARRAKAFTSSMSACRAGCGGGPAAIA